MHFLVTGGSGFIGSHVTEQLLAKGHRVTVVDNFTTGHLKNLPAHPHLRLLQKDVLACKPEDFPNSIDGVAHLAATPSVAHSWSAPLDAHQNNLSATLHVIQLCRDLKVSRLVFASSAAVYGGQFTLPITETQEAQPISPYGLQKLVSEQYGRLLAERFGFSFVALRLFNVFGERQLPTSEYSGVISIFTAAMQSNTAIAIYGDGTQTRDFVYVKDVAKAFASALTIPIRLGAAIACNIGTGQSISLNQLVSSLREQFPDWQADVYFAPARSGDIQHSRADISQAAAILGFAPDWSVHSSISMCIDGIKTRLAIL